MNDQLDLFAGRNLLNAGMEHAEQGAENKTPGWTDLAYQFLLKYAETHNSFMGEDVRVASKGIVPPVKDKRAWGPVLMRAARAGIIERAGYGQVKNPKAHASPGSVWKVVGKVYTHPGKDVLLTTGGVSEKIDKADYDKLYNALYKIVASQADGIGPNDWKGWADFYHEVAVNALNESGVLPFEI